MLRLTLEMVPFGLEDRKYTIGVVEIANVGGNSKYGNYVAIWKKEGEPDRKIEYKRFDRSTGAWSLVGKILRKLKIMVGLV